MRRNPAAAGSHSSTAAAPQPNPDPSPRVPSAGRPGRITPLPTLFDLAMAMAPRQGLPRGLRGHPWPHASAGSVANSSASCRSICAKLGRADASAAVHRSTSATSAGGAPCSGGSRAFWMPTWIMTWRRPGARCVRRVRPLFVRAAAPHIFRMPTWVVAAPWHKLGWLGKPHTPLVSPDSAAALVHQRLQGRTHAVRQRQPCLLGVHLGRTLKCNTACLFDGHLDYKI